MKSGALTAATAYAIYERRKELDKPQSAVFEPLGLRRSVYSRLESSKLDLPGQNISIEQMAAIARALGLEPWELMQRAAIHEADARKLIAKHEAEVNRKWRSGFVSGE